MATEYESTLLLFVNGQRFEVKNAQPDMTLLSFLRQNGLTGTKLGCGEGGCGACTVCVSFVDLTTGAIKHRAVNACLAPLCSVEGCHVITVEGIGSQRTKLHPVQERLAALHGSQCGFCTPGFVMSLYVLLKNNPTPTEHELEEAFTGNLCRCTGYRPILEAAKSFAADYSCGTAPQGCGAKDCCRNQKNAPTDADTDTSTESEARCVVTASKAFPPLDGSSDFIFPPELRTRSVPALRITGETVTWYRPLQLEGLCELKQEHPHAKLIVGNTEVGIETKFKNLKYPVRINTSAIREMNQIVETDSGLEIGSSVTLSTLSAYLQHLVDTKPAVETSGYSAIIEQLRWFASTQIRNVASLGGNIATASPISDMNPLLLALNATLKMVSAGGLQRSLPIRKFFLGYRMVDLLPNEVLVSVTVPRTQRFEYVRAYKQARRREDDIAIVNAGCRVKLEANETNTAWIISDIMLGFGGMAPISVYAMKTEQYFIGKEWSAQTLEGAYSILASDLPLASTAPGGMIEFRRSLTCAFLFKFFLSVSLQLQQEKAQTPDLPLAPVVAETERSAVEEKHRPVSTSQNEFPRFSTVPVGRNLKHSSAVGQVTGEAKYCDDLPDPSPTTLHGYLVLSSQAHAKIFSIDTTAALALPGAVGFYGAKDVTGSNRIGAVILDEDLFATETVTCVGQMIGVIVATSFAVAEAAAKLVNVQYEPLPAVLSIEDAIEKESYFNYHNKLQRGDVEQAFATAEHVAEGEMRIGGQEHFYLETNCTVAIPGEHNEMQVWSSTQNPTKTQNFVASVLGVHTNEVVCHVKRLGGGFGGKETRTVLVSCAAALPAYILRRPVRISLDRHIDMAVTGQRHPFIGKYKVAFDSNGKIVAVAADLYSNGGNSLDLSGSIMDRALLHLDNAYFLPNARFTGHVCKTNLPSNTAFRGFGGPQGMLVCESIIDKIASTLKMQPEKVRETNFYKEGMTTHYGQLLDNCYLDKCWDKLMQNSDLSNRMASIEEFNKNNRWKKRGIAAIPTKFGISFTAKFLNQGGALVHINQFDGSVLISHGGTEMGQGLHIKMLQIAATALNIPIELCFIAETATDKVPNTSPTAASASADINGMAVLNACSQLKERLQPYFEKNPSAPWKDVIKTAYYDRVNLSAQGFYATPNLNFDWTTGQGRTFNYYTYGASCSEVEVDVLTGNHEVLRSDIAMDIGKSLNPAIDIGQIEGGFVQGVGWCTIEELVWGDKEHPWVRPGMLFTAGPGTYKIPSANDVPVDFRVHLVQDVANPYAVYSSKAIGEPPFFLAASVFFAIKNAVTNARSDAGKSTDFAFHSPATAERIRMACLDQFTNQFVKDEDHYRCRGSY
eukprot:GILJ01005413.1.p1 GENE.GILJ01005413.1~~GILJ01005413.1.p1  ORF type:complete len:1351 (+),score=226.28 GILJ01005413.1:45-4097(+)